MKLNQFNFQNLNREDILKGLGVFFVTISLIVGISANSSMFRGTVSVSQEDVNPDENQANIVENVDCEANENNLENFIPILSDAIRNLNGSELSDGVILNLEILAEGIYGVELNLNDDFTNCSQVKSISSLDYDLTDISLLNQAIRNINSSIRNCNECSFTPIPEIELIITTESCNQNESFNSLTQQCEQIPIETTAVCSLRNEYEILRNANNLLLSFRNNPEEFNNTNKRDLELLLNQAEVTGILDFRFENFSYSQDSIELSNRIRDLADQIIGSNESCRNLNRLEVLTLSSLSQANEQPDQNLFDVLNGNVSCPLNSIYDAIAGECYCPISDEYIDASDSCNVQIQNPEAPDSLICSDGTIVSNITECAVIPNVIDTEEDIDIDQIIENELNQNENPTLNDPTEELVQNLDPIQNSSNEISQSSNENTVGSLNSNTNANVMASGIVKGDTGPSLVVLLLFSLVNLVGFQLVKKSK